MVRRRLREVWKENLYRNSIYLIFNSFIMALFGFVFWILAAKSFSSQEVGLATAVISAVSLVANISLLGFTVSILKFKNRSLNYTALVLCSVSSFFISCLFLLGVHIFSPNLSFLTSSWTYVLSFIACVLLNVSYFLTNPMLVAQGHVGVIVIKDTIFSATKVLLLFEFSGVIGLLLSWYLGVLFAILICLFFVHIERKWFNLKEVFHFSFFNYLSTVLALLPPLLFPLLILHTLGASSVAYFYIVWMIATLLWIIPNSMAQNLLSSGNVKNVKKAYLFSTILMLLGVAGIFTFGKMVLSVFNPEYSANVLLLYVLALAVIPYGLIQIHQAKLNIEGRVKRVLLQDVVVLVISILGSLFFIQYGLLAIGVSWLVGNIFVLVGVR